MGDTKQTNRKEFINAHNDMIKTVYKSDIELYKQMSKSTQGAPMFVKEDLYVQHDLDQLFRYFCIKIGMSYVRLRESTRNYWLNISDSHKAHQRWTNDFKTLKTNPAKGGLTYRIMTRTLCQILGFIVEDIQMKLYNPILEQRVTVSLSEVKRYLNKDIEKAKEEADDYDDFFQSETHRLIFALVKLDNNLCHEMLDITEKHYRNKTLAEQWRNTMIEKLKVDKTIRGSKKAFEQVELFYKRMIGTA